MNRCDHLPRWMKKAIDSMRENLRDESITPTVRDISRAAILAVMALKVGRVYKEDFNSMYYVLGSEWLKAWRGIDAPDLGAKPHTWWEEIAAELEIENIWNK